MNILPPRQLVSGVAAILLQLKEGEALVVMTSDGVRKILQMIPDEVVFLTLQQQIGMAMDFTYWALPIEEAEKFKNVTTCDNRKDPFKSENQKPQFALAA